MPWAKLSIVGHRSTLSESKWGSGSMIPFKLRILFDVGFDSNESSDGHLDLRLFGVVTHDGSTDSEQQYNDSESNEASQIIVDSEADPAPGSQSSNEKGHGQEMRLSSGLSGVHSVNKTEVEVRGADDQKANSGGVRLDPPTHDAADQSTEREDSLKFTEILSNSHE